MLVNQLRDWNTRLRLNAASCVAAPAIYRGACEVELGRELDFDAIDPVLKLAIIAEAADAIQHTRRLIADFAHRGPEAIRLVEPRAGAQS